MIAFSLDGVHDVTNGSGLRGVAVRAGSVCPAPTHLSAGIATGGPTYLQYLYRCDKLVDALEKTKEFSMALSKLGSLYKAVVADHSAHPIIMVSWKISSQ